MNDEELISGLLSGEPETVELVRAWMRASFVPYRSRLASDLEDLEQEILLEVTSALREDRFERRSSLRTYVRTYVSHKCIDQLRARARREWLDVDALELPSSAPSPLERVASTEMTDLALRRLEDTAEACRELWQMLREGMKYREMSERLGVAEGTLRVRVLRCRKAALELRETLQGKKTNG